MSISDDNIHVALEKIAARSAANKAWRRGRLEARKLVGDFTGSRWKKVKADIQGVQKSLQDTAHETISATANLDHKKMKALQRRTDALGVKLKGLKHRADRVGKRRQIANAIKGGTAGAGLTYGGVKLYEKGVEKGKGKKKTASVARDLAKKYKDKKR